MGLIDIERAMRHVLAEPEDQDLVQDKLDAAEEAAMAFLNRRVFADQADLDAARAGMASSMEAARAAHSAAVEAANAVSDQHDRRRLLDHARQALADAHDAVDAVAYGMVLNASITSACLLIVGHLFANREEVVVGVVATELPIASKSLLGPYRTRLAV